MLNSPVEGSGGRNGKRCVEQAERVRDHLHQFADAPTDQNLAAARTAWLEAREAYGISETSIGWLIGLGFIHLELDVGR